jgi:signal transduction histidine kinase
MQPRTDRDQRFTTTAAREGDLAQGNQAQRNVIPGWVLDLLLGIAVALVIAIVITADQWGTRDPDAIAYLFAGVLGALMLVRRRFPVAVLLATMLIIFVYYMLDYPAIGLAVPVAAALYSAAELGHLGAAVIVAFILIVVSTYARLEEGQAISFVIGYELISTVALMAASIALGDSTRSRRALAAEQEQSARLIAQEHARRAEQQIQEERVRMARDLHDLIGHTISVISLHADVAKEAVGHDDEAARQALRQIRTVTSETMRELRATVRLLRNPTNESPDRAVISLANLPVLVESARASGLAVDLQIEGEISALPATVEMAAYRIVQESLTNVMRHANATHVTLKIAREENVKGGDELRLQITDNGKRLPGMTAGGITPRITPGSGITGMAERARLLGGTLTAQALPAAGFEVKAALPITDQVTGQLAERGMGPIEGPVQRPIEEEA